MLFFVNFVENQAGAESGTDINHLSDVLSADMMTSCTQTWSYQTSISTIQSWNVSSCQTVKYLSQKDTIIQFRIDLNEFNDNLKSYKNGVFQW